MGQLTVEIAIISDTHLPRGSRTLPAACVERLRAADLIIHAGDLARLEVLEELRALGPVIGVQGNVDNAAVRATLPTTAIVPVEDHRLAAGAHREAAHAAQEPGAGHPAPQLDPAVRSRRTRTSRRGGQLLTRAHGASNGSVGVVRPAGSRIVNRVVEVSGT